MTPIEITVKRITVRISSNNRFSLVSSRKMHSLIVEEYTLAANVTRIRVLGSQRLSIAILVAVHVAFISWQIVQVSAVVRFRAAIVRILVHRSTTEPLVIFQYAGTLRFIADLFSENIIKDSESTVEFWKSEIKKETYRFCVSRTI